MKTTQIYKSLMATVFALFVAVGLAACGGGGGDDNPTSGTNNGGPETPDTENPNALTGFAQKGPLQAGGTITLEPLSNDGTLAGGSVTASLDELGGYAVNPDDITWDGPTLITARGPYFNENKGVYENAVIGDGLQAIAELPVELRANINLFTHLVTARTRHLMQQTGGPDFRSARTQARDELAALLAPTGPWPVPVSENINPLRLNLLDREKVQFTNYLSAEQDSVSLLLFSSALLTVLEDPDWASKPIAAGGTSTSEALGDATSDFADDGNFNGDGQDLFNKIKSKAGDVGDLISKATDNLKDKFNKLELFPEAPNIDPDDATNALKEVLEDRYLGPDVGTGRTLDDYIETNVSNGYVRVSVGLDKEGRLVPNEQWRDANEEFCQLRARYITEPSEVLNFKIFLTSETDSSGTRDQYSIFAQVLTAGTSFTQAQQESGISAMKQAGFEPPKGSEPDQKTLAIGMENALDGLKYKGTNQSAEPKAAASNPCGEINLTHVSGSKVDENIGFRTGFSGVDTPGLQYSYYYGDGTSENNAGRNTTHIYSEEGTYSVRVEVFGTVDGEDVSGNQTIQVKIGEASEYTLHFDSYFNYELDMDNGGYIHSHSRYAVDVPLTRGEDGAYRGATLMDLKQKPDVYNPDLPITVPDGPRPNIWVWATIPGDGSTDTLDVRLCFDPDQLQSAGAFAPGTMWGGMFVQAHQGKLHAVPPESGCPEMSWKFRFTAWNTPAANDVLAENSWERVVDTGVPSQEKTYIKVLK